MQTLPYERICRMRDDNNFVVYVSSDGHLEKLSEQFDVPHEKWT